MSQFPFDPMEPCPGCVTPGTGNNCNTVQLLEPNDLLTTIISSGAVDQSLDERGDVLLGTDQTEIQVVFNTQKAGTYRFEYLYVDAFGIVNPGTIKVVPIVQTAQGFTAELAGMPTLAGYVVRWRVVVFQIGGPPIPAPDPPDALRVQLLQTITQEIFFNVPRTTTDYGFTELRIENLDELPGQQYVIGVQVVQKQLDHFVVTLSQVPPSVLYYLVVRTP